MKKNFFFWPTKKKRIRNEQMSSREKKHLFIHSVHTMSIQFAGIIINLEKKAWSKTKNEREKERPTTGRKWIEPKHEPPEYRKGKKEQKNCRLYRYMAKAKRSTYVFPIVTLECLECGSSLFIIISLLFWLFFLLGCLLSPLACLPACHHHQHCCRCRFILWNKRRIQESR